MARDLSNLTGRFKEFGIESEDPSSDNDAQPITSSANSGLQIRLPGLIWTESKFANAIGEILGPLNVIYRCDERVVEIENEEFNGELDRFKLTHGGLKFKTLSPIRAKK